MDAYTSNYFEYCLLKLLKKLYCLNIAKQQERDYKAHQKTFNIPFDMSMFTDTETNFSQNV